MAILFFRSLLTHNPNNSTSSFFEEVVLNLKATEEKSITLLRNHYTGVRQQLHISGAASKPRKTPEERNCSAMKSKPISFEFRKPLIPYQCHATYNSKSAPPKYLKQKPHAGESLFDTFSSCREHWCRDVPQKRLRNSSSNHLLLQNYEVSLAFHYPE